MANSPKGSGNPLLPIAIIGVVVVAIIAGVLAISEEEAPPDQPTIIPEDSVDREPAGVGTHPEGEPAGGASETERGADEVVEGITDQVDEVEPAADGVDSVPAADRVEDTSGSDTQGETDADEQASERRDRDPDNADRPTVEPVDATTTEAVRAGGADGQQRDQPAAATLLDPGQRSATEEILIDEETVGTGDAENVDRPAAATTSEAAALPAGRDAQTDLNPSECQDIVRDSETGDADVTPDIVRDSNNTGAAFIPTPVGPDANNRRECLESQE